MAGGPVYLRVVPEKLSSSASSSWIVVFLVLLIFGKYLSENFSYQRERINHNDGFIEIQYSMGAVHRYGCNFREPAASDQISTIHQTLGYRLPEDYIEFLTICNGCELFLHPEYSGEKQLFGTQDLVHYHDFEQHPGRIRVARINTDNIVMDLKDYQDGKPYLDRLVITNGSSYWYWGASL
ncbi:SMI1/KNR4 family protein [Paenibacillus puerhi]|uniref:SMI1/KNR4 family protein n=1 Tax=Paenibacillus puerhi TaxID=2692622 RepID=UPI00135A8512|nr:SMI1/KNR4 family protein [Paenibacillus puerhi]